MSQTVPNPEQKPDQSTTTDSTPVADKPRLRDLLRRAPDVEIIDAEDITHLRDLHAAMVSQATPRVNQALYLTAATLLVALIWASFAQVEEITQGEGKVIAISGEQIIQSLEGGIVEELNVKEGDIVEKGQQLLKLDAVKADSVYSEGYNKMVALMASVARLQAEVFGKALQFPDEVKKHPELVRNETESYEARRRSLNENVAGLTQSLKLSEEEINKTKPLVAKGLISDIELTKMMRQANDVRIQITERRNKYRADANLELARAESELAQAKENVAGREDVLNRTIIRASVRGTVKNIRVKTIGGVVQPAVDIMEIVPLDDQLLIEAKIKPKDVAFLRPGLPAMVKITAYDFSVYGGLQGKLDHISADTLNEERRGMAPGEDTYYKVLVKTDSSSLKRGDKTFPIMPGMTTTVDIRTGEKTVLEYLLKPVFKSREAFRER